MRTGDEKRGEGGKSDLAPVDAALIGLAVSYNLLRIRCVATGPRGLRVQLRARSEALQILAVAPRCARVRGLIKTSQRVLGCSRKTTC